jgi:DNA-binding transcriptional ArsR family regulator
MSMSEGSEDMAPAHSDVDSVFEALAHPVRREVLRLLSERELTANALAEPFAMSRPAVSQHLRVLREAGLVRDTRSGRHHVYVLVPEALVAADRWLEHFRHFWPEKLLRLHETLERRRV